MGGGGENIITGMAGNCRQDVWVYNTEYRMAIFMDGFRLLDEPQYAFGSQSPWSKYIESIVIWATSDECKKKMMVGDELSIRVFSDTEKQELYKWTFSKREKFNVRATIGGHAAGNDPGVRFYPGSGMCTQENIYCYLSFKDLDDLACKNGMIPNPNNDPIKDRRIIIDACYVGLILGTIKKPKPDNKYKNLVGVPGSEYEGEAGQVRVAKGGLEYLLQDSKVFGLSYNPNDEKYERFFSVFLKEEDLKNIEIKSISYMKMTKGKDEIRLQFTINGENPNEIGFNKTKKTYRKEYTVSCL